MVENEVDYLAKAKHEHKIRRARKEYNRKNWLKNFVEHMVKLFKR